MKTTKTLFTAGAAMVAIAIGFGTASQAQTSVADFYQGKKIKIIVGLGAGSTYSAYARTLSHHMGQYIPGKPGFIVQNMPGAGSLKAYNHIYNIAAKDGTVFGTGHRFVPIMPLFDIKGARFDGRKFKYIGSVNKEVGVTIAWHTAPFKTFDDVLKREMIVGTSGRGAQLTNFTSVFKVALGAKFKVITGYKGTRGINLAIERGEVQGRVGVSWGSLKNAKADWLRDKKITILMQMGLRRHPELPNVPNILEVVKPELDRTAIKLLLGPSEMGRPYLAPPGIPHDRLTALRTAFNKTMKDAGFKAEAAKRRMDINPMTGSEVQNLIARLYQSSSKEVIARAKVLTAQGFDPKLRKKKNK